MIRIERLFILLAALLALTGCATTPAMDTRGVNYSLTPVLAASDMQAARGTWVQWGGMIVSSRNLAHATQLIILAYPLDSSGEPKPDAGPLGRFVALWSGYLETVDYAPGRWVTVVGTVSGTHAGSVGQASYLYPVVDANQLHLWPKRWERNTGSSVNFGVGVFISN